MPTFSPPSDGTTKVTAVGASAPITSTGGTTPTIGISPATSSNAGSLSANDKLKIDSVSFGAQVNSVVSVAGRTGAVTLTAADVSGAVSSVSGTAPIVSSGGTTPAISITPATDAAAGSMSAADKEKLDFITVTEAVDLDLLKLGINVLDYGADPTGANDSAAAIQAACDAAHAASKTITANTGAGTSTNRRYASPVLFPPGKYKLTVPIVLDDDNLHIHWRGYGAMLCAAGTVGTTGSFAGDWAVQWGTVSQTQNAVMFVDISGLVIAGFPGGIRGGIAPNNVDQCLYDFTDCHFVGPVNCIGTAVRLFTRSTNATFTRCNFQGWTKWLDIQSCDKTVVQDSWIYYKSVPGYADRPTYDANAAVYKGQLFLRNNVFIPGGTAITTNSGANPYAHVIAREYEDWVSGTAYIVGDLARESGTLYVCKEANDDASFTAGKWDAVDETAGGPLSEWTTIDAEGCLFGAEGGQVPAIIWDVPPEADSPAHNPRIARLHNNHLAAYSASPIGAGGSWMPQILLVQLPNRIEVTGNVFSQATQVAADYHTGATAPTPFASTAGSTLAVVVENNSGAGVGNPNWFPNNLVSPYAGTGITAGSGTVYRSSVSRDGHLTKATIYIDLTGLSSVGTADDVIGVAATANPCTLGLLNTSDFSSSAGAIPAIVMTCIETPAGGDTDIDLVMSTTAAAVYSDAFSGMAGTSRLLNSGGWAAGNVKAGSIDVALGGKYLYLIQGGTTGGTYTAGRFLIEITGYR